MKAKRVNVLRKLGWGGLLFFTLTGLLWLAVPAVAALLAAA